MQFEIKQIIPAPGWRAVTCGTGSGVIVGSKPEIRQAVGWGVCEFHAPEDVRVHGYRSKFTEVELLLNISEDFGCGAVLPLRMLEDWGVSVKTFQPGKGITVRDLEDSLEDANSLRRTREEERQEIVKLYEDGHCPAHIMSETNADVSTVEETIRLYKWKEKMQDEKIRKAAVVKWRAEMAAKKAAA